MVPFLKNFLHQIHFNKFLFVRLLIKKKTFSEDLSELIQHEIDHLNGILATDHLKNSKQIVMRHEWEQRFK